MTLFPSASAEVQSNEWKYSTVGGWLIPVAIGLCLSPILQSVYVFTNLIPIFQNGAWSVLTTPGTKAYDNLWAPVILLELLMNVGFILFEGVLLFFLFKRKRLFPRLMISYLFALFALVAVDYFLAQRIPAVAQMNDLESKSGFVRSGIVCAVWVPYFMRSKRVKGTFLN